MSIRSDERISFRISELSREQQQQQQNHHTRRRAQAADDFATAAAVAGACHDVEAAADEAEGDKRRESLPKLKSRRAFCGLLGLWTLTTTCFAMIFLFQTLSEKFGTVTDDAIERRLARDSTIKDKVAFGIWDARTSITPLQLQVAVSMALGVRADDGDIEIKVDDNSFFEVRVEHATIEEVEYIASITFLERLNVQMSHYGGSGVLSKPPRLVKNVSV